VKFFDRSVRKKKSELFLLGLLFVYLCIMLAFTPGLGKLSGLLPRAVIPVVFILVLIQIGVTFNSKMFKIFAKGRDEGAGSEEDDKIKRELIMFGWVTLMIGMFFLLGPLVAIVIIPFLMMKFQFKKSWVKSIAIPLVTFVVIYLVFVVALRITFPVGILFKGMM